MKRMAVDEPPPKRSPTLLWARPPAARGSRWRLARRRECPWRTSLCLSSPGGRRLPVTCSLQPFRQWEARPFSGRRKPCRSLRMQSARQRRRAALPPRQQLGSRRCAPQALNRRLGCCLARRSLAWPLVGIRRRPRRRRLRPRPRPWRRQLQRPARHSAAAMPDATGAAMLGSSAESFCNISASLETRNRLESSTLALAMTAQPGWCVV